MTNRQAPTPSSAEIRYLHRELAADVFATFAGEIGRACEEHGFLDADDALGLVMAGRFVPLAIIVDDEVRGLVLYEFRRYPKHLILHVAMVAGQGFSEWGPAIVEKLKEIAALSGAEAITSEGRSGWLKVARRLGFATMRKTYLVMETRAHEQGRRRTADSVDQRAVAAPAGAAAGTH